MLFEVLIVTRIEFRMLALCKHACMPKHAMLAQVCSDKERIVIRLGVT